MFDPTGWLMGIDAYAIPLDSVPTIAAWRGPHGERISFVQSYLKTLNLDTVDALLAAGIAVGAIWETVADRALQGIEAGIADGQRALAMMQALQAPASAAICATVDQGVSEPQEIAAVDDYFAGFDQQIFGHFQIAGYADGTALADLRNHGLPLCWLAGAKSWPGYEDFLQNGKPDMVQGATMTHGGIWMSRTWPDLGSLQYDPDIARPDYPGFIPAKAVV